MISASYIAKARVKSQSHVAHDWETSLARKMFAVLPAGRIQQTLLVLVCWFTRQQPNDVATLDSTAALPHTSFRSAKNGSSRAVKRQA